MTQINYDVLNRPKKGSTGRTNVGWAAECARDAVPLGGYLITRRTLPGEKKQYTAMVLMAKPETGQDTVVETMVGTDFETRATAAFAIWRKYYEGWRDEQRVEGERQDAIRDAKRLARVRRRFLRSTPEGQKAYREELNAKARARWAALSAVEKATDAAKRRTNREDKSFHESYTGT